MLTRHWLAAAAGALALGMAASAEAAPLAGTQDTAKASAAGSSEVQNVYWGHRRRYYRPFYYGGGPYFYFGPRYHHRRHWRHRGRW
jgi:hypothetical protein